MTRTALLLASAFLITACATAPQPDAAMVKSDVTTVASAEVAPAGTAKGSFEDPDRQICKRQEVIGSNFKKKVCMSAQEWEDASKASRDYARRVQSQTTGSSNN